MLMEDEGYVKPASRESRLVMVQLEPSAEKKPRSLKQNKKETKDKNTNKKTKNKSAIRTFLTISWKHIAIGKGFMAAHAHDIRLKVRRKRSNIIGK